MLSQKLLLKKIMTWNLMKNLLIYFYWLESGIFRSGLTLTGILMNGYIRHLSTRGPRPHRSSEKTLQIKKHIRLCHNVDYEKKKPINFFLRIKCFFIWTNLNPPHLRMLCAKFCWNSPNGSGEDIWISSMYFQYFVIISPW